jgi:hypothetical protein
VIECDTVGTAASIYANCDGREFEQSGNVVDLRYVPDDTDFTSETPTDTATAATQGRYHAKTDLVTGALNTSSVKLTWDQDDPERAKLTRQAIVAGTLSKRDRKKVDVRDVDLAAYLASASSSDGDGDGDGDDGIREEYRRKLLSKSEDVFARHSTATGTGPDLKVAFTSALATSDIDAEATFTMGAGSDATSSSSDDDDHSLTVFQRTQQKLAKKKADRRAKRRAERKAASAGPQAASAAELAALMRHSHANHSSDDDAAVTKAKSNKSTIAGDARFRAVLDEPEFAIDPSVPGFKRTEAMQAVLEERARRRVRE